jgi:hypothetical protein
MGELRSIRDNRTRFLLAVIKKLPVANLRAYRFHYTRHAACAEFDAFTKTKGRARTRQQRPMRAPQVP